MKNILIGLFLLLFLLFGCINMTNLEKRVSRLEQLQDEMMPSTELAGADARWRNGRTGGSTDIDDITGMANGDWAFSIEESGSGSDFYPYIYDSTNCSPAADGTIRIDGSGGGCWYLVHFHVASLIGEASDGDHYTNFSNSGIESYTESDGDITARRDWNIILFEDSTDGWIPQTNPITITTSVDLDLESGDNEKYCFGGMVVVTTASTVTLPPLSTGAMEVGVINIAGSGTTYIDPDGTESIIFSGTELGGGYRIQTTVDGAAILLRKYDSDTWIAIVLVDTWTSTGS